VVQFAGLNVNGAPDGGVFLNTGLVYCAFSSNLRRVFSSLGPVQFTPAAGQTPAAQSALDTQLTVSGPDVSWDMFVQTDQTVQLQKDGSSTFKWRRFPRGAPDVSTAWTAITSSATSVTLTTSAVTLEHGLSITFGSTTGKNIGDSWQFDVLMANPSVTNGTVIGSREASCIVPPYAALEPDTDTLLAGQQHEVKVSLRGTHGFGPVVQYSQPGGPATLSTVTGAPQTPVVPSAANTALVVDGYYTGDVEQTYEVTVASGGANFTWRRYSGLPSSCDLYTASGSTPIIGGDTNPTQAWQLLDQGVYIRFETQGNKTASMSWVFTAKPFWSTGFSPVTETTSGVNPAATPSTRLVPVGVQTSAAPGALVYQVNISNGNTTFSWRRWPYGSDMNSANNASTGNVPSPGGTAALEYGVSIYFTNTSAVYAAQSWTFTAFGGHVVTFGATSGVSSVATTPANANNTAPMVTNAAGTASVPAFVGTNQMTFTVMSTSGTSFVYSINGGSYSSNVTFGTTPVAVAYGIFLTWPTPPSPGTVFSFTADAVPSTAMVTSSASPFSVIGSFAPGNVFTTRDANIAVYFPLATTLVWRLNTAAWSSALSVPTSTPKTLALGSTGLVLLFTATPTTSSSFVIAVTSFVPRVDNVTTIQAGARASPAVSAAVPNPPPLQQGLPTGVAVPYSTNTPGSSPSLTVLPTPGFVGSAQSVTGGVSASLPQGYPSNVAPGVYPVLYLQIVGTPIIGPITSPVPQALTTSGTFSGATSLVFVIVVNGTSYQYTSYAPGGSSSTYTTFASGGSINNNLTATITGGPFPSGTSWTFTALAGATYQYRRQGNAQWSPVAVIPSVANTPVPLCCGVSVIFSAATGYKPGDQWSLLPLTVTPGGQYTGNVDAAVDLQLAPQRSSTQSAFQWRIAGGNWSAPQVMSGVDFVVADPRNKGLQPNVTDPQLPNVDVLSSGTYTGTSDATYVIQIETTTSSFQWASTTRIPFLAASLNSSLGGTLTAMLASLSWTPGVAITGNASSLSYGVSVTFMQNGSSARTWNAGDTYFIEARTGTTADLGFGLQVTWSAAYGYTGVPTATYPGDQWHFNASAAIAARGPHNGGTQLLLQGSNFLPSNALTCQLVDWAGHQAVLVPATYVSSSTALCRTPPRTPDGLTVPVGSRAGAPNVRVSGAYSGARNVMYVLSVATVNSTQKITATVVDEGLYGTPVVLGNLKTVADGVTWWELPDGMPGTGDPIDVVSGVYAQFDLAASAQCAGAQYLPGDRWTFTAYALEAAALGGEDADPEVQPGSVKPGVFVNVSLSNDAGQAWSDTGYLGNGLTTFLYSPVYVSPSGDDGQGDGTRANPYATLARGVGAALSDAKPGVAGTVPGLGSVTNWDEIKLLPGRYSGGGNSGVQPGGRALLVQASQRGAAVIDCAGNPGGDVVSGDKFAAPGQASTGSISLQGIATENCGAAYVGAAAAYPTMHWWGVS